MNETRLAVREYRIDQWMQIIQDRNQSGLTIQEYCQQNGLNQNAYYYWLRIIRHQAMEEGKTINQHQEFVELPSVQVPESTGSKLPADSEMTADPGSGLTLEFKGVHIQVQASTSMRLLSKTLEVVSHVV